MQQDNNATRTSETLRVVRLLMPSVPLRISTRAALILMPALALGIVFLGACGPRATQVDIRFGVAGDEAATIRTLQFYVHAIELIDEHGKPHPFRFEAAAPWQSERVALLDLA